MIQCSAVIPSDEHNNRAWHETRGTGREQRFRRIPEPEMIGCQNQGRGMILGLRFDVDTMLQERGSIPR